MTNDGKGNFSLTDRESTVLALMCGPRRYRQIAQDLGISINTVHRYAAMFFRACNCHCRAELAELMQGRSGEKAA